MSNDLVFGVRLDGSSSTLVSETKAARDELINLQKSTEDLAAASAKMASATSNDYTKIQQAINDMAIAEDNARDKAWALANGYKDVGGMMVKASADIEEGMVRSSHASAGVTRELIVMGHEAATGNFSRIPGTMMVLAERSGYALSAIAAMNPVVLGITAVVAAGAVGWYEWGKAAEEAANKASKSAEDAEKSAKKAMAGVHKTIGEQMTELQYQMSGVTGQLDGALAKRGGITGSTSSKEAQAIGTEILSRRAELAALQRQSDDLQAKEDKNVGKGDITDKLLADAKRFDDQMLASHEDAFTKEIIKWKEKEQSLIDAGLYGGEVRAQHEAAYTVFVNAETEKRNSAADKAQEVKDKHLAAQLASEDAYFAKLEVAANQSIDSASGREDKRYADENIAFMKFMETATQGRIIEQAEIEKFQTGIDNIHKRHEETQQQIHEAEIQNENAYFLTISQAAERNATTADAQENRRYQAEIAKWTIAHNNAKKNNDYSLEEEKRYQDLRDQLIAEHQNGSLVSSKTFGMNLAQFEAATATERTQIMAAGLAQMTAVGAQKHRELFEINKIASLANATISGLQAVQDSFKFGAVWGGPWGGAAMAAIAAVSVAANLEAINSTSFGGGAPNLGGGGVPSMSTSPGVPVSVASPNTATTPAAPATQPVNIYIQGNVLTTDFINNTVIPQIKDQIANADVTIIDPRSRQAQMLAGA